MIVEPRRALKLLLAAAFALAGAACAEEEAAPAVVRVPDDRRTIQGAVNAAGPGDMVLIAAGTYHEQVVVRTPGITVRGVDRNAVVLDGEHDLGDGIVVTADGVAIENLTVRNYREHGVLFSGEGRDQAAQLAGYRVAYVTASNNGVDGIAALASTDGSIDHAYASGHPGAGIAIGGCSPCNAVVSNTVAESNAIGFASTSASGSVFVVNSIFRGNRVGMTPNSQGAEQADSSSEARTVVAGNLVVDNDNAGAPAEAQGLFGVGISVGGGSLNTVLRNRVSGHGAYGIGVLALDGVDPVGNRVEENMLAGNGVDLYFELLPGDVATFDNCFTGNEYASSIPDRIEDVLSCDVPAGPFVPEAIHPPDPPPAVDHRTISLPAPQPTMPGDGAIAPQTPADRPDVPDLDTITVPGG